MNIKYTVKNVDNGCVLSCVLDPNENIEDQLTQVFKITPGHGIGVYVRDSEIEVTDYYHASSMAEFEILSKTETPDPVSKQWTAE